MARCYATGSRRISARLARTIVPAVIDAHKRKAFGASTMIVARRGNPLHISESPDGIYLATLREGLGGKVSALRDDSIRSIVRDAKGAIRVGTQKLCKPSQAFAAGLFNSSGEYRGG